MSLTERVRQILIEELAPALDLDSAALEVLDVSDGIARIRLGSVCSGCPSMLMTVINGLESELRKRIPEINCLEVVP
jgi:Fe-S cluster biogenesis protein NfuA